MSVAERSPVSAAEETAPEAQGTGDREKNLLTRVRSGGVWVVIGRAAGIGLTLLMNVLLARLLTPTDFGRYGLLMSIVSTASLAAMFGLNRGAVRLISQNRAGSKKARILSLLRHGMTILTIASAVVAVAVPLILRWIPLENLPLSAGLSFAVGGLTLLLAWQQTTAECFRGFHEQRWANLLGGGLLGGPVPTAVFLLLFLGYSVVQPASFASAAWMTCLALALTIVLSLAVARSVFREHLNETDLEPATRTIAPISYREIIALCAPLMLLQLTAFAIANADVWIAGYYVTGEKLGFYVAARRVTIMIAIPMQLVQLTVLPWIAQLHAEDRLSELEGLVRRAAKFAAIPAMGALAIVAVAGGPLLGLLFGNEYADAAHILTILSIGQAAAIWFGISGYVLQMCGYHNTGLGVNVLACLALAIGGPLAVQSYGATGLAWAAAAATAFQSAVLWLMARKLLGINCQPAWRRVDVHR